MHFSASVLVAFLSLAVAERTGPLRTRNSSSFPIPASKGSVTYKTAKSISGTFDGGLKTYGRGVKCGGQAEGGNSDAVFLLADGATLKNAIIGKDQSEGVHCLGACTIENVWWDAVCEDALTFKGDGNGKVIGGGARGADDKVIQHNGAGSISIDGFTVQDFGKLYRSCGNCKQNGVSGVPLPLDACKDWRNRLLTYQAGSAQGYHQQCQGYQRQVPRRHQLQLRRHCHYHKDLC
jgi:hypothetical protein